MSTLYQTLTSSFNESLHWLAFFFTALSIFTICYGFLKSIKTFIFNKERISFETIIREGFDKYILISLEFLIIADIIDTIILRDLQNIILVLLIVIIRTIMSWEIEKRKK